MSMRFNPFYGYSIKTTSGLNYQDNDKLTGIFKEVDEHVYENDDAFYPDNFCMADEFDDYPDYVFGVEAYDIHGAMKEFEKMNSGDGNFINVIQEYYDYASTKLNCTDINLLKDYMDRVKKQFFCFCS